MKKIFLFFFITLQFPVIAQQKITVGQEAGANYKTVQAAIDAVPVNNHQRIVIHISNGVYKEVINIPAGKDFITLEADDNSNTILTYNNHTGTVLPNGTVADTRSSASCFIYANDFIARNIAFRNDAGFNAGQAVALRIEGDRAAFYNCKMTGFQDVLFLSASKVRHYFRNCYVEGTTDFIFGAATAVFDSCHIHSKKNSHVTAASTDSAVQYGFVFFNCRLTGDDTLNKVSLGRPWRPYANVTYINCYLEKHIIPEGWSNWKNTDNHKTARYAEYHSGGPGANPAARVNWSRQLSAEEAKQFTLKSIFGDTSWIY